MKLTKMMLFLCLFMLMGCGKRVEEISSINCIAENCSKPIYKDSRCADHYVESELSKSYCIVNGCKNTKYDEKYCVEHYIEKEIEIGKENLEDGDEGTVKDDEGVEIPLGTSEPTPMMEPTATPEPTAVPTAAPKPTMTPKPTAKPKPTATLEPTATPKPTAKSKPTSTPKPTAKPKPTATPKPQVNVHTGFSNDVEAMNTADKSVIKLLCFDENGNLVATGSGFVAFNSKTIVTNYHCVDDVYEIVAVTNTGKDIPIKYYVCGSLEYDVAILETASDTKLAPLELGDSANMKKGEKVVAIGSPQGYQNIISTGNFNGYYDIEGVEMIQFTAPISSGSSGGALFDDTGKVVGLPALTHIDSQNLNFAVKIEDAKDIYSTSKKDKQLVEDFYYDNHVYTDYELLMAIKEQMYITFSDDMGAAFAYYSENPVDTFINDKKPVIANIQFGVDPDGELYPMFILKAGHESDTSEELYSFTFICDGKTYVYRFDSDDFATQNYKKNDGNYLNVNSLWFEGNQREMVKNHVDFSSLMSALYGAETVEFISDGSEWKVTYELTKENVESLLVMWEVYLLLENNPDWRQPFIGKKLVKPESTGVTTNPSGGTVTQNAITTCNDYPLHLYSNDGRKYLGKLVTNKYDSDSIWNSSGKYGSRYASDSIWNEYGTYGSKYSSESAFNTYAMDPPIIVTNSGKQIGFLTANEYKVNGYTILELERLLSQIGQ